MIVLKSLFSGIDGFALGLQRAGIDFDHYYSEIEPHAIAITKHNFPNAKPLGSVTDIQYGNSPKANIITFGSPCQDFSLAGKRQGLEGQRSSLIQKAIDLITHDRPDFFIWENVKGVYSSNEGRDFQAILREFTNIGGYRLEWQLLNTKWVLPQNRERVYLVGHLASSKRSFKQVFPIGENGKISTQRDNEQSSAQYATTIRSGEGSKKDSNFIVVDKQGNAKNNQNHASTLTAGGHSGGNHSDMDLIIQSNTAKGYEIAKPGDSINLTAPTSKTRRGRVGKGKAQTLDTSSNQAVVIGAMRGRNVDNPSDRTTGADLEQRLEINKEGTSNTLTAVQKDNYVVGKTNIRRLTPIECERLQGFPDNWTKYGIYDGETKEVADTNRYKCCGNAVTVDIVQLIANRLKENYPYLLK